MIILKVQRHKNKQCGQRLKGGIEESGDEDVDKVTVLPFAPSLITQLKPEARNCSVVGAYPGGVKAALK